MNMQKLALEVIEKITSAGVTSNELNLILYIGRYQDEFGKIRGIYYKSACEELEISFQGFYDALRGLEEKGIIKQNRKNKDYDIVIIGNNKDDTNNYKHGYISLRHPIFRDKRFLKLTSGAKLLGIHLVRRESIRRNNTGYKETSHSYQRIKDEFLDEFSHMLKVTERTIRYYLGCLKPFLSIYLEAGRKYYITFHKGMINDSKEQNVHVYENEELRKQQSECAIRRNRIKNETKVKGLMRKLSVFTKQIMEHREFDLSEIIHMALERSNNNIKNPYKWKRTLNLENIESVMVEVLKIT